MKINRENIATSQHTFSEALLEETQACFASIDAKQVSLNLVSVGGLAIEDVPMSGTLRLTESLQGKTHLHAFLACFKLPLGRVCLVRDQSISDPNKVLYKNAAYPFFYQAFCIPLSLFQENHGSINTLQTIDNHDQSAAIKVKSAYLLVEIVRLDRNFLKTIPTYLSQLDLLAQPAIFDNQQWQKLMAQKEAVAISQLPINLLKPRLNILSTDQMQCVLALFNDVFDDKIQAQITLSQQEFLQRWDLLQQKFSSNYAGEWSYQSSLNYFRTTILSTIRPLLKNLVPDVRNKINRALNVIDSQFVMFPPAPQRINRELLKKARLLRQFKSQKIATLPQFEQPIFIVSAPRAGSTLLFETLSQFKHLWSTGEENHALIEDIVGLHPQDHDFSSNRLNEYDVSDTIRTTLKTAFTKKLINRTQQHYLGLPLSERPRTLRFLEKTPKNALRIPFIKALFPDALFIYLSREQNSNVSSLIDGWRSQRFFSYKNVPEFENRHWSFLLTPNWQTMHDKSIAEIALQQWQSSNQIIKADLANIDQKNYLAIHYQDLIDYPEKIIRDIAEFANLTWDRSIQSRCEKSLPVSRLTLTAPQKNKWLKHQEFMNIT